MSPLPPCPSCSRPVAVDLPACPHCGAAMRVSSDSPTLLSPSDAPTVLGPSSSSPTPKEARFVPGALVAGRYRLVALLGRGGMGEVYRADDLKLGQSVALKFLPLGLERDGDRLTRFLDEVRTARQVTHPNVCRVYDIDEFEGQHFLSMEYVDGEDLASLLRRIGRLPEERAVEVARQICAGLAAVHDAGVLHRDLKPANVMIDGRGRVRLTDFGLASLAGSHGGLDARAGTPAYMAPEQHAGAGVSVQSDLYALGLVLYELFTGHAVFEASTAAELSSLHASSMPSRPSSHVQSLDPAVERAVMRCLEKEPSQRPISALAVSASLPGGDPLAAALAAGETPSPELVAESGVRQAMRVPVALGLALVAIALFLAGSHWAARQSWLAYFPFDKRPEVLQDRALDLLATLGYTEDAYANPADRAWGWLVWNDVLREVEAADSSSARWEALRARPDVGGYWYRQGVVDFVPEPVTSGPLFVRGPVQLMSPPSTNVGDISVLMDLDGTLRRFEAMPRRFAREDPSEPDWDPLFAAAGFDRTRFVPDTPRYQRFLGPDLRRAWVGTTRARPDVEYRVEAGAFEGRVVLFNVAPSGSLESLAELPVVNRRSSLALFLDTLPEILILLVVILVARLTGRNLAQNRADTRGAWRFGSAMAALFLISHALRAHTLFGWQWAGELWYLIGSSTFIGVVVWAMYLAAEPIGRQVWPTMFVSSGRILSRSRVVWRDPLVGRSLLAGLVIGAAVSLLLGPFVFWLRELASDPPVWRRGINLGMIMGGRHALGDVLDLGLAFTFVLLNVSALVVLQRWVRRRWLAGALAVGVWSLMMNNSSPLELAITVAGNLITLLVLLRWGVVAYSASMIVGGFATLARAVDYGHWTAEGAWVAIGAMLVLTAYAVWAATGSSGSLHAPGRR